MSTRLPGWLATGLAVAVLVVMLAPEASTALCRHRESLIAEFGVGHRAAIVDAIPALRNAPELRDEASWLENGSPVFRDVAEYEIAMYRCLEYSLLPIYPPLLRDGYDPPPQVDNVVTIRTNAGTVMYSDVDFTELRLPGAGSR